MRACKQEFLSVKRKTQRDPPPRRPPHRRKRHLSPPPATYPVPPSHEPAEPGACACVCCAVAALNWMRQSIGCCGVRPKPPKPPVTLASSQGGASSNYVEDYAYLSAEEAHLEPVYDGAAARRARRGSGGVSASGDTSPQGLPVAARTRAAHEGEDQSGLGLGSTGVHARPGVGVLGRAAGFFAPSNAAAGRDHVSVVQGASGGLGLQFCRQLLERRDLKARSGGRVFACCRNPSDSEGLQALKAAHGARLTLLSLDVLDEASIDEAAQLVAHRCGVVHLLVNASGVLHIPGQLQPETSLSHVSGEALSYSYRVNAVGPMLVLKAFSPLLLAAARLHCAAPVVAANLSARVSSVRENKLGGWHAYRASKAALNMLTKTAAVEFAKDADAPVLCLSLHPGTVDTPLSRPFNRNGATALHHVTCAYPPC